MERLKTLVDEVKVKFLERWLIKIGDTKLPLSQYNTFCFGVDSHRSYFQHELIGKTLELYAQPGDVFLVEGFPANETINYNDLKVYTESGLSVPEFVNIKGWDDMEANIKAVKLLTELKKFSQRNSRRLQKSDEEQLEDMSHQLYETEIKRNQSLINTIKEVRKNIPPSNRIFVIMGSAHLTNSKVQEEMNILRAASLITRPNFVDRLMRTRDSIDHFENLAALGEQLE